MIIPNFPNITILWRRKTISAVMGPFGIVRRLCRALDADELVMKHHETMATSKFWGSKFRPRLGWDPRATHWPLTTTQFGIYNYIYICIYFLLIYLYYLLILFLSGNSRSSRIKLFLARNFRELHVYLSRNPCWATMPLMKIHSSPAKLRQIKDHFLVAL